MLQLNVESFPAFHSDKSKYYGLIVVSIIAVPIAVILFLTLQGPLFFTVIMSAVLLGVLFLLGYFTLSSATTYELSSKAVRVNFGLLKKTVKYGQIVNVEVVKMALSIRLFGASMPGFHWGLFSTTMGKVHVYATKANGDYVILTLDDGEKIALSPKEPEAFLASIKQKQQLVDASNQFLDRKETQKQQKTTKQILYIQVIAVSVAYIAFLAYFFSVYVSLPQIVPLHFGFDGVANRFGDKSELLLVPAIIAIFPVINAALTLKWGRHERGLVLLLGAIFTVLIAVFVFITSNIAALS